MIKKIPMIAGIAIFLLITFLISFNVTKKVESRNAQQETSDVAEKKSSSTDASVASTADTENTDSTVSENSTAGAESSTAAEVEVTDNSTVLPTPTVINMPTDNSWSTVLINKYYKMNDTYEPTLALVLDDSGIYLEERVAEKFKTMYDAAAADGVTLTPAAGYVSLDRQERKFEKQVNLYVASGMSTEEAQAKTAFTILPAGCSESNYGLAVDIGWLSDDFAESPAYQWLKNHAAEYGFVERYTASKADVTHFNAQPWHWRYVGADAAKAMNEQGLCLEEYVGKVN